MEYGWNCCSSFSIGKLGRSDTEGRERRPSESELMVPFP
jgi:hypothetical protein